MRHGKCKGGLNEFVRSIYNIPIIKNNIQKNKAAKQLYFYQMIISLHFAGRNLPR